MFAFLTGYDWGGPYKEISGIDFNGFRLKTLDSSICIIKDNMIYCLDDELEEILSEGIFTQRDIELIGAIHGKDRSGKYSDKI